MHQENCEGNKQRTNREPTPGDDIMNDHDPETKEADGETKDAYDEFEQGIRRVGAFIRDIWSTLTMNQRISHILELATLIALVFYAGYTVKIYKANNTAAEAAKKSADTAVRQLEMVDRPWIKDSVTSADAFRFDQGVVMWNVNIRVGNFRVSDLLARLLFRGLFDSGASQPQSRRRRQSWEIGLPGTD